MFIANPAIFNVSSFDPASLALTGWWRASYSGSPWVGTASAGVSGSRNISDATNPPTVGSALNGLSPAAFNGTNQSLAYGAGIGDFISATALSLIVLFNATAAVSNPGAGSHYTSPYLFGDTGTYAFMSFDAAGVTARVSDAVTFPELTIACATGGWHLAQMKYGSSTLSLRVDGGSWSTTSTCASIGSTANTPRVGVNSGATSFLTGRVAEVMVTNAALADAVFDQIKAYIDTRYALSL